MKAHINASLADQQKKADLLCKLTKMKIAQLGGSHHAAERGRHLQHALKFCHRAQAVLARERRADYDALDRVTGMAHKWHVPAKNKHLITTTTTNQHAQHLTWEKPKRMNPHTRIGAAASKIEGSVKMRAMAMCRMMQKKVRALGAQKTAIQELALRQAKAFCKKANSLISKEVGLDYAAVKASSQAKAQGKATPANLTEKPRTHKAKYTAQNNTAKKMKRSMKASAIIRAMLPQSKAQKRAAKTKEAANEHKLGHIGHHTEGSVRKRAVAMCKAMQHKVRSFGTANTVMRATAMRQAKAFCNKAKELVAKEVRLDRAALKSSKKMAKKLRLKAKSMAKKQRKLIEEEESVKEETKLRQHRLRKMAAAKKKIRASAEKKMSELNEKRLKRLATAEVKKLKLKQHKLGNKRKKLTAAMKSHLNKVMKTNKDCKGIIKNLHAMNHQIAIIDGALLNFELL